MEIPNHDSQLDDPLTRRHWRNDNLDERADDPCAEDGLGDYDE